MIFTATKADASQIKDITARAGVFSQDEIDSVPVMNKMGHAHQDHPPAKDDETECGNCGAYGPMLCD
jgi:hypothetical protein